MSTANGKGEKNMAPVVERLRRAVEGVPPGGAVTLPVSVVRSWLEGTEEAHEGDDGPVADLTVEEIAEAHDKAPSTVRGWLQDVPGTYRLGNELRIPRDAWREYLDALADGEDGPARVRSKPTSSLDDWRES